MRNRPMVQMLVVGVVAIAIGIPIVLLIPWYPANASKQAANFRTLYDVLLVASVPVFVLVETVVVFCVWKFRMRPGEENKDGPPIHGNTRLEVVWTVLPALMLISLCTFAYAKLRANEDSRKGEITINVTERQFAFEFSYPEAGGKTVYSSQLYMADGQPVVFKLRSYDVIHSFFVPEFAEKLDAVPGITTTVRVTPTKAGTYPVECTELCGAGHSLMRTTAHVVAPSAYLAWLRSQPASTPPPIGSPPPLGASSPAKSSSPPAKASASPAAKSAAPSAAASGSSAPSATTSPAAGKAVFTGSAGCGACHVLAAAGTNGTIGPNLDTAVVPDAKKRGLSLKAFILESITKPNAFISPGFPSNTMPQSFSQTLTATQLQALVNFIAGVTK